MTWMFVLVCACATMWLISFLCVVVRVLHVHWLLLPRSCLGHHGRADQPDVRGGQRDPHFCLRQQTRAYSGGHRGCSSWVPAFELSGVLSWIINALGKQRNELFNDGNDFE
jgi:hypothetical protein